MCAWVLHCSLVEKCICKNFTMYLSVIGGIEVGVSGSSAPGYYTAPWWTYVYAIFQMHFCICLDFKKYLCNTGLRIRSWSSASGYYISPWWTNVFLLSFNCICINCEMHLEGGGIEVGVLHCSLVDKWTGTVIKRASFTLHCLRCTLLILPCPLYCICLHFLMYFYEL